MEYNHQTLDEFLSGIASPRVTPAGGSAAAVVGAVGTSLCEMACIHTIGKEGYEDVEPQLSEIQTNLQHQRRALMGLAGADAEAVSELLSASEETSREIAAMKAVGVPITIAKACSTVLDDAVVVTATANENAVPDAGTGSYFVHSTLESSLFTARTNLQSIEETPTVRKMQNQTAAIERAAEAAFGEIIENIQPR
ncbi:cyclodeaminase/cyclohydrolase family protein [Halomarina rubra]|uniref:Cyclodeaminase/cyclohydrolase family protein n=1 Tax=Halomarina rubra TaxID=2071873 RepID=A0ABD6AYC1_9EURY|nr:cyclodeaminase/cyclohydrolase family protein [Halomarina rubra]